jgi:hypothetical protein
MAATGVLFSRPLILGELPTNGDELFVTASLGPQAPRGPPALLA